MHVLALIALGLMLAACDFAHEPKAATQPVPADEGAAPPVEETPHVDEPAPPPAHKPPEPQQLPAPTPSPLPVPPPHVPHDEHDDEGNNDGAP